MENDSGSIFFVLVLILTCGIMVLEVIELAHLVSVFNSLSNYNLEFINSCLKFPLLRKSVLLGCEIAGVLFLMILSFLLIFKQNSIVKGFHILNLKFFTFILGPTMLCFSLSGMIYWDDVVYDCYGEKIENKYINASSVFAVLLYFILGLFITLIACFVEVLFFQIDSILRKSTGSDLARKAFWYFAFRARKNQEERNDQRSMNISNNDSINRIIRSNQLNEENGNNNV